MLILGNQTQLEEAHEVKAQLAGGHPGSCDQILQRQRAGRLGDLLQNAKADYNRLDAARLHARHGWRLGGGFGTRSQRGGQTGLEIHLMAVQRPT